MFLRCPHQFDFLLRGRFCDVDSEEIVALTQRRPYFDVVLCVKVTKSFATGLLQSGTSYKVVLIQLKGSKEGERKIKEDKGSIS